MSEHDDKNPAGVSNQEADPGEQASSGEVLHGTIEVPPWPPGSPAQPTVEPPPAPVELHHGWPEVPARASADDHRGDDSRESSRTVPGADPAPTASRSVSKPGNWRSRLIWLTVAVVALAGGVTAIAGYINGHTYYLVCGAHEITAARGRFFPPFGKSQLSGPEWQPIADPRSELACATRELSSSHALAEVYRELLFRHVDSWLAEKWPDDVRTRIVEIRASVAGMTEMLDAMEKELEHALQLSRGLDDRSLDFQGMVRRRMGDISFWRGQIALTSAITSLDRAAEYFEKAAKYRPTNSADWDTWRYFVAESADMLGGGPPLLHFADPTEKGHDESTATEPSGASGPSVSGPARLPFPLDSASTPGDASVSDAASDPAVRSSAPPDGGPEAPSPPPESSAAGPLI